MSGLLVEGDKRRAARTAEKKGPLLTGPFARFNLNLDGSNPDWIPQESAGEGDFFARTQIPELTRKIPVETGQKINSLLLNGDRLKADERKRGLVYITEFNTSITHGPCGYRLRAMAKQLGCPVLGLDNPGIGGSSRYTKEQSEALREYQDFGPTAEALVDAIIDTGMKEVSLVGVSMGGWAAPTVARIARERGIKVNDIIMVSMPGTQDRTKRDLKAGELSEINYLPIYQSRPYDPEMRRVGGLNSPFGIRYHLGLAKAGGRILRQWFTNERLVESMAKGNLEETTRMALADSSGEDEKLHVTFMYSTGDNVSLYEANNRVSSQLKDEFPGQVHSMIIPGETHLFYENGNRFASLVRLSLLDSPLLQRDK